MSLFPNESIQQRHGFEFLTYFQEGHSDKPLIVFFPGWGHLARIAYGGADIIPFEDSLAYAFQQQGYSFLAISYPLENAVYSTIYPQLKIKDWAQGAASIIQDIFKHSQYPHLLSIHWSAAGHMLNRLKEATQALGLLHPFSISLEATPPLMLYQKLAEGAKILDNNLVSLKKYYQGWIHQLQTMLRKEIDFECYEQHFLGAIPISLLGTSLVYEEGQILENLASSIEDRQSFQYTQSPLVVSFAGNSQQFPYHPIVDKTTWSYINNRKIYHGYLYPFLSQIQQFPDDKWRQLCHLTEAFIQKMIHSIEGNHFLFIGQKRVQKIVNIIQRTEKDIFEFRQTLTGFFNIDMHKLD